MNINFTNQPVVVPTTFSISGFKIDNATGSGIQDWNITLMNDTMQTSMLTLEDGSYNFMNLANGTYNVTEETRPGFTNVSPTTVEVTINGSDVMNINFTNNLPVPPPPPTNVTVAVRIIEKESLREGESTNITVNISSTMSQAISLREIIPAGWNLTRISDDADAFKNSTNEWIWFSVTPGINNTVIYRLTAPGNASIGTYHINGTVSNSSGMIAVVQGDNTITLDIIAFYRRLGSDPDRVETTDVLAAIDDWKNNRAPAGFERAITTQELLTLIDEWLGS